MAHPTSKDRSRASVPAPTQAQASAKTRPALWKRLLMLVFYLAVAFFLYLQIRELPFETLWGVELHPRFLVLGAVIAVGHRFLYPLVWTRLLQGMGARLKGRMRLLYRVYSESWVGRYIPGKVAMLGARIVFAERLGIGRYQATVSFSVEYLVQAVVWIAAALVVLLVSGRLQLLDDFLPWLYMGPLLMLFVLLPPVLNRLTALPLYIFGRKSDQATYEDQHAAVRLHGGTLAATALIHVLTCGCYMLEGWAIVSAVQPMLDPDRALLAGAIFPIAVVLGMFVLFAPAGLGAREPLQMLALQSLVSPGVALVMVVLHRSVELGADLLFWLGCRLIKPDLASGSDAE